MLHLNNCMGKINSDSGLKRKKKYESALKKFIMHNKPLKVINGTRLANLKFFNNCRYFLGLELKKFMKFHGAALLETFAQKNPFQSDISQVLSLDRQNYESICHLLLLLYP